jgi:hypothetical protein
MACSPVAERPAHASSHTARAALPRRPPARSPAARGRGRRSPRAGGRPGAHPPALSLLSTRASAEPPAGDAARVTVRSEEPDLVVGAVKSRAFATGGGYVASGVSWDEKCTAPCTFDIQPGIKELVFQSPNFLRFHGLRLRPGQNDVYVDPGSSSMRTVGTALGVVGFLAAITGLSVVITRAVIPDSVDGTPSSFKDSTGWALPVMVGGIAALGGGITLSYVGRVKVEENSAGPPAPPAPAAAGGFTVRMQGSF